MDAAITIEEARQRGVAAQEARARARIAQIHIDANNLNIQAEQARQNANVQFFFGRARRSSRRPRRSSASFGKKRRSKRRSASFGKRRRSGAKPKTTRRRSASFGKRRRSATKRKTSRR